jgi:hypothetical protein
MMNVPANLQHFRDCAGAGGDRWQSYLDALTSKPPPRLDDRTTEPFKLVAAFHNRFGDV